MAIRIPSVQGTGRVMENGEILYQCPGSQQVSLSAAALLGMEGVAGK